MVERARGLFAMTRTTPATGRSARLPGAFLAAGGRVCFGFFDHALRNAGGTSQPLIALFPKKDWISYAVFAFSQSTYECARGCRHDAVSVLKGDLTAKTSVDPLSANLFEVVLLEISDTSEKLDVGSRFQMPLVLGSRQLDSAQIIGDLREPVQFGGGVFVYGRLTRDGALDSEVKRLRYDALPVIVVDFHLVKVLQIGLLRSKEALHVGFYCSRQLGSICDATAFLENECGVSDGKMFREYSECMKLTLPAANVFPFVVVLPIKQWVEMKGDCIEQLFREGAFVLGDIGLNGFILPMEHQSDKVKIGLKCRIARFVYENRQLPHEPTPFKIKMSGGKPPDARRSLYSRKPLILYHAEHFLSSRNYNKQMFEIQCKLAA